MSILIKVARTIRHLPMIRNNEALWNFFRKPYHRLLNIHGNGVPICIGRICTVRVPPEYTFSDWESYEPETIRIFNRLIGENPNALILDIGSSIGIFCAVALSSSRTTEVIAFDSDLASLKAVERLCTYVAGNRLKKVYGFLSSSHLENRGIEEVTQQTSTELCASTLTGDPGTTAYICLNSSEGDHIPTYSLDGLYEKENISRPIIIKCDVEGAELQVLEGSVAFIKKYNPIMLLSIHPEVLKEYNSDVDEIKSFLSKYDYSYKLIAIDHEEHWLCKKNETGIEH